MIELRRVVLDVLKPHDPNITVLAKNIAEVDGIEGVNISVYEIDQRVENVKVTVEGKFPDINNIKKIVMDIGATIHSIDEVAAGKTVVQEEATLHDRILEQHDK
ncbi:MAG: hypothetical protein GF416_03320 [Candidatus Altiarchaeales archaeon]|nr:hypothetical protein [Candidatus Altiarchaeales archaeon]MBD3416149.1 hypothetical protein [Candidatus Altiarchaeales archaeon]